MKTASLVIAISLLLVGTAGAVALPAASPSASVTCSGTQYLKEPVQCAKWVLQCVGDALAGQPCHRAEAASASAADPKAYVDCVKQALRNWLQGTPQPCAPSALAAESQVDPKKMVDCTKYAAGAIVNGNPVEPCDVSIVGAAAGPDPMNVVSCTKQAVRNFLQGTPQPCPIGETTAAAGPEAVVDCVKYAAVQVVNGNPIEPCAVNAAGPDVVECTKKAVRDLVQGTPQPCPL